MSLMDFDKPKCPVCNLPEVIYQEMAEGFSAGIRYKAMSTWLAIEHKLDIPASKIDTHFQRNHDARKPQ